MQQKPNVLRVVKSSVCGGPLLGLFLVARLAGVDTLEDAETPEISESDLEKLEGLVAGDVGLCRAFFALFLWSAHGCRGVSEKFSAAARPWPVGSRSIVRVNPRYST